MKQLFLLACAATLAFSCDDKKQTETNSNSNSNWAVNGTIYELNTRQLTPEGTFKAATAELEKIKELGVDIVWVMPVQPIGKKDRKGSLGSYYAISDYTAFNPEFGTRADFQEFVDRAHSLGMKVILDWVANHTSPDNVWAVNDGWHKRDSLGQMKIQYDWYDIVELDYTNQDMRNTMQGAMKFWVDSLNVDGFRCDMAMLVPTEFWESTVDMLKKSKPDLFMLSEAEEVDLTEKAFDMHYAWNLHHVMNAVAQGKVQTDSIWNYFAQKDSRFAKRAFPMVFTSNHDENSHAGTEFARMGVQGAEAMAVFTYLVPGMPLIYTGQEYGSDKQLRFFDKDTIARNVNASQFKMYQELNKLRKENKALWSGEAGGDLVRLENDRPAQVFSMKRAVEGDEVVAVFNFSNESVDVNVQGVGGKMQQYPAAGEVEVVGQMSLKPWEYRVYYKK